MTIDELADEITELAGHINAAMARWLALVGEFDAREGWAEWGCQSCAHWVAWRCSIAPGSAREHVRVARSLRERAELSEAFASGELSYSKVRALTRVEGVEAEGEAELLALARSSTAAQLEKVVRAHRGVTRETAERVHEDRHLRWFHDDDGALVLRGRLAPDEGAVVLKALALLGEREAVSAPAGEVAAADVPAGTSEPDKRDLDALVLMAEQAVAAAAEPPGRSGGDRFQVVVHVDVDALEGTPAASGEGSDAGGAHLDHGPGLARETVRRLCCDAALVGVLEREGTPLDVGRKTRAIPPALRRALRARDGGCRFPGCTQHRWVDAHHIVHWARGGATSMENLVQLCRHHHRLVHEGGYAVERHDGGRLVFLRPDGRSLRAVEERPRGADPGRVAADNARLGRRITPQSTVPDWWGERLDLGAAVDVVLAAAPGPPAGAAAQPASDLAAVA